VSAHFSVAPSPCVIHWVRINKLELISHNLLNVMSVQTH